MEAMQTVVSMPMPEAEAAVRDALSRHGFGVLTEIDVGATLKAKLGVDRPPLRILGACNPGFAHRSLQIDPTVALLLPCNVVLEDAGDGGRTRVSVADPRELMGSAASARSDDLAALADEAASALESAVAELTT